MWHTLNFLTQYNYVTGIGFPWQQLLRRTLVLLFFMAAVRSDTGFHHECCFVNINHRVTQRFSQSLMSLLCNSALLLLYLCDFNF